MLAMHKVGREKESNHGGEFAMSLFSVAPKCSPFGAIFDGSFDFILIYFLHSSLMNFQALNLSSLNLDIVFALIYFYFKTSESLFSPSSHKRRETFFNASTH